MSNHKRDSMSSPSSPVARRSSSSSVVRPSSSFIQLEDLEPGGVVVPPSSARAAAGKKRPAPPPHQVMDTGVMVEDNGRARRLSQLLEFTPIVGPAESSGSLPGQTTAGRSDADAEEAKSTAGDSFTTAASTLTLGGVGQAVPTSTVVTTGGGDGADVGSGASSLVGALSTTGDFCKICHCGGDSGTPLIAPCFCCGSLKYVHQECLQRWIKSADIKRCELCKYPFSMQSKVKPFCQWEKLDMSSLERRKLLCSVTFHVVAVTCVVWSLYVLVDRTAQEIRMGQLQWPFWTKLVVVAIGFTGGLVFMYIQCKVYLHLCRKWKAYNRIIVVQDAPEGIQKARAAAAAAAAERSRKSSWKDCSAGGEEGGGATSASRQEDSQGDGEERRQSAPSSSSSDSAGGAAGGSSGAAAGAASTTTTSKTNAETQTALRGVSIVEVMRERKSSVGEVGGGGGGSSSSSGAAAAIFFTECESSEVARGSRSSVAASTRSASSSAKASASRPRRATAGEIREPVLICDLPGASGVTGDEDNDGGGDASSPCHVDDVAIKTGGGEKSKVASSSAGGIV